MTLYIGLDDTDTRDRGGTGRLARALAGALAAYSVGEAGPSVSRHQLLQDPRVPCTRKNRCSCVRISAPEGTLETVVREARDFVVAHAVPGSDPGLCVAVESRISARVMAFGREAKETLLDPDGALTVAAAEGLLLESLGGTPDGVIGALAAVGLRRSGRDGWLTQEGALRSLGGVLSAAALRDQGCEVVDGASGQPLPGDALVDTHGKVRPEIRGGSPVLRAGRTEAGVWVALKA